MISRSKMSRDQVVRNLIRKQDANQKKSRQQKLYLRIAYTLARRQEVAGASFGLAAADVTLNDLRAILLHIATG